MKQFPTTADLATLGIALDHDGFGPHENTIAEIVALARVASLDLAAVGVLGDMLAPDVVRARAFSVLAANWEQCRSLLPEQDHVDARFAELVAA